MRLRPQHSSFLQACSLLWLLPTLVASTDLLKTDGFSTCGGTSDITVQRLNIEYDKGSNVVTFDVAGTSTKEQKVMATLVVTAYGKEVYRNSFNPCDDNIAQLCPVPAGSFAANGTQAIPANYASQIPAIAFSIPDLDGMAKLQLNSVDGNETVACIESTVNNGKTAAVPAVSYVAAGIAGAALLLSAASALGAAGTSGVASPSPTFGEVIGWFQSMAMNGMMSVQYPSVYRSFTQNFGFSGLLIPWQGLQEQIDSFRQKTGGNLTDDSVAALKNTTLVYQNSKRSLLNAMLTVRDINTSVNNTSSDSNSSSSDSKTTRFVHGIQGYVEELTIPQANTFMTVLLIFAVIVAAIIVGILLFKVILETWALFGSFPKRLTGFRKRYWLTISKTITNLILLLYGIWTLYCVYQLKMADAWAPRVLAGVTLALFTLILLFFTYKIWSRANKYKKLEGDTTGLYEDKETWRKYSLFYENYKKGYWWLFIPAIIYMFAKGVVIAAADGKGLVQTAGQLIIESLLLILLLWARPYSLASGNWINIVIQVVRVLSVVCILVFVEELGIAQSTKTITGVVLIVMQSVLTGVLAILIAVNSIVTCCRENPHRRQRKEAEKLNRDLDNLTPLDARNDLLMDPQQGRRSSRFIPMTNRAAGYDPVPPIDTAYHGRSESQNRGLLDDAASMGARNASPPGSRSRQPRLPEIDLGQDMNAQRWNRF